MRGAFKSMEAKKPWHSKTVWMNLFAAIAAFTPVGSEWIASHEQAFMIAFSALNIVLRFVTKDKISVE